MPITHRKQSPPPPPPPPPLPEASFITAPPKSPPNGPPKMVTITRSTSASSQTSTPHQQQPPAPSPSRRRHRPARTPSPSRAESTTADLHRQIRSAVPSTVVPTSASDLPSLPTLDDAPPAAVARSHLVLAALVLASVALGWLVGFDLLQFQRRGAAGGEAGGEGVGVWADGGAAGAANSNASWYELAAFLGGFAALLYGALHWIGISQVDFWAMLNGYWWLSVPVTVAALAAVTVMQERATELHEIE